MLLTMKALIDAMRAIIYTNAEAIDLAAHHPDDEVRQRNAELVELLIPVSKGFGTDMGIEVTSLAIQVYGGMGYIEESGVPQHYRDARITTIYEGTNGIQAMDLVGRKLPMRGGGVMADFLADVEALDARLAAAGDEPRPDAHPAGCRPGRRGRHGGLADRARHGRRARRPRRGHALPADVRAAGRRSLPRRGGAGRHRRPAVGGDADEHLEARVTVARFYAENLLPAVVGLAPAVTAGHADLYAVGPDALAG